MDDTSTLSADAVIAALRSHDAELQSAGVRHLSLFGSVARGDSTHVSDVDLAVELDPAAHVGLFHLMGLQRRLSEIIGCKVDLLPEPAIRGLGNWLRHAYDRIVFDVIWDTEQSDLPRLKSDVQAALARGLNQVRT